MSKVGPGINIPCFLARPTTSKTTTKWPEILASLPDFWYEYFMNTDYYLSTDKNSNAL